jgi:hypothetical protein
MRRELEELFEEYLLEEIRLAKIKRERYEREKLDFELDEIDRKRWGYPPLRSKRWRRR